MRRTVVLSGIALNKPNLVHRITNISWMVLMNDCYDLSSFMPQFPKTMSFRFLLLYALKRLNFDLLLNAQTTFWLVFPIQYFHMYPSL